jgi:hypothetical protein
MPGKNENFYIVPEIDVKVHESWIKLVQYCQSNLQYGDLRIQISNSIPTKRMHETPNIRFDKQSGSMRDGITYYIKSIDTHVHESWIYMVQWCQNYFVSGVIEFKLVGSVPTELISADQKVDFSKLSTIPPGIPLKFSKV